MRGPVQRRCHYCAKGPYAMRDLIIVLELPMRYHFCTDTCIETWQQTRHDDDVVDWLKLGTGERAKILREV